MSNKKKIVQAKAARPTSSYKFADLRAEAAARTSESDERPELPPFILDDVAPPIVITAPDTLERQLIIAEMIGANGVFEASAALPLLRALCGPAFGQIWALIKDDRNPNTAIALVQTLVSHFYDAIEGEASELPGGSEGSSD